MQHFAITWRTVSSPQGMAPQHRGGIKHRVVLRRIHGEPLKQVIDALARIGGGTRRLMTDADEKLDTLCLQFSSAGNSALLSRKMNPLHIAASGIFLQFENLRRP